MNRLKKIISINENPAIVSCAQTPWGKIILLLVFAFIMRNVYVFTNLWQHVIIITVFSITFMPKFRYLWIFIGMLCLIFQGILIKPEVDWELFRASYLLAAFENGYQSYISPSNIKYIDIIIMLLVSETLIYLCSRFHHIKLMQYPFTISYVFLFALILAAAYLHLPKSYILLLWSFVAIYNHYFFFTAYTLLESSIPRERNYLLDYGRYLPVWGFTELPYGKGSVYLTQVESKTSEEFAITQLKGIKLAFWALILSFALHYMHSLEGHFHIPNLELIRHDYEFGQYYSVSRAWLCLWDSFFRQLLELTVMGHFIVSTCRMCGFRILRNTYKPLQAPTVAEYWNRYNFYFKELLAVFFFYPTFFRYFKNMNKFRLFFAAVSAATFGNILFHFLLLTPVIMSYGFIVACKGFFPFACYALVLGISIGISQLRNLSGKKTANKFKEYIASPFLVLFFYSVLGIFNTPYQRESIIVNLKFLASLFKVF